MSFTVRPLRDTSPEKPKRSWKPVLLKALVIGKPVVSWYIAWRQKRDEKRQNERRLNILKRVLVILITVLCATLVLAGTVRALVALKIVSSSSIISATAATLPEDSFGHTNILLVGTGDESHDGVDLTDSMMVASFDEDTESVSILSIPRDLYVLDSVNMGKGRINSLYRDYKNYLMGQGKSKDEAEAEGLKELGNEVGRMLDVPIHGVIKIDFIGFVQAVDALGGVEIDVPFDIVDPEYPGPNYSYETFSINAGKQVLDGETALKYARSRHTTSDFSRSARQQQLLKALGEKARNEGLLSKPSRITELLGIVREHFDSTFSARELLGLASLGKQIDTNKIQNMGLNSSNGLYGDVSAPGGLLYAPPRDQFQGASVLLPVSIPEFPVTWKQVHILTDLFFNKRTPYENDPLVNVLNGGAKPGSVRLLASELTRFGFNIDKAENAEDRDQDTSSVTVFQKDEALGLFFADMLKMPLRLSPDPATPPSVTPAPIVTIVLGKDYAYTPVQTLLSHDTPTDHR